MRKKVLVPIADGVEEIEAVCIIDVLRRAGAEVTVAAVDNLEVTAARGVRLVADWRLADCAAERFDLIALPGGLPGAEHLRDCAVLTALLRDQAQQNRLYAAICAAPAVVLQHHGLLAGRRATCHPALADRLDPAADPGARVVVDGNCVTSQGPGTALEFALELVARLFGPERAEAVAGPMLARRQSGGFSEAYDA
ncbi:MAG: DJ-1 family glyoxalase III [Desulfobacterales bacterium]